MKQKRKSVSMQLNISHQSVAEVNQNSLCTYQAPILQQVEEAKRKKIKLVPTLSMLYRVG